MNQLEISFGTPLRIVVAQEEPTLSRLTISDGKTSYSAKGDVMYTMPVDYSVTMQVSYVDVHGNPATVDSVVWSSSDSTIAVVQTDSSDVTKCLVQAMSNAGQCQITAVADADLGSGTRNITTLCDLTVIAGEAVAGTISPVGDAVPPQAALAKP